MFNSLHTIDSLYVFCIILELSSFGEKCGFVPAAQFSYRKCLSSTDGALLITIFHHLQKSLDEEMVSYVFHRDF